ncbi:MAG: 16S rRNA (guanine(527)-N(7))-methyltransferase RsmG [Oscillospiraceae bacterium]
MNEILLKKAFDENKIQYNQKNIDDFNKYSQLLVEWNEKINLTAITDPDGIAIKHFYDSIMLLKLFEVVKNCKMIDVGTGAGFPSIPCKILRKDIKITLLDSLNKRINFLKEVSSQLGQNDNVCVHARAEDGGKNKDLREKFDVATARAVANLANLSEYCLPFVKIGGYFVALKGPSCDEEMELGKSAIAKLGGEITDVITYKLPDDSQRTMVIVKKISQTPTKYPRTAAKIAKEQL